MVFPSLNEIWENVQIDIKVKEISFSTPHPHMYYSANHFLFTPSVDVVNRSIATMLAILFALKKKELIIIHLPSTVHIANFPILNAGYVIG